MGERCLVGIIIRCYKDELYATATEALHNIPVGGSTVIIKFADASPKQTDPVVQLSNRVVGNNRLAVV